MQLLHEVATLSPMVRSALPSHPPTISIASPEALRDLGASLGAILTAGDTVGLLGPLGAGKTTLTQGIARGLGVAGERHVASPTFALVNQHPGRVALLHADLYRVESEAELAELGLDEEAEGAVRVIEWLDRFPSLVDDDVLLVRIAIQGDGRAVTLEGAPLAEARFQRWLAQWTGANGAAP